MGLQIFHMVMNLITGITAVRAGCSPGEETTSASCWAESNISSSLALDDTISLLDLTSNGCSEHTVSGIPDSDVAYNQCPGYTYEDIIGAFFEEKPRDNNLLGKYTGIIWYEGLADVLCPTMRYKNTDQGDGKKDAVGKCEANPNYKANSEI